MALPVLDGNQSATTLSSVVTGGEHIVAHSVVCLGSTAISNITSAVSGSVVSVSNFPASQSTTFGAVTGSVSVLNFPSTQTIAGTVTANIASIPNVLLTGSNGDPINDGGSIPVFLGQAGEIYGTVTANLSEQQYNSNIPVFVAAYVDSPGGTVFPVSQDLNAGMPISGTVTVGNSVTIGSLPAISGTVTAAAPNGALTTRFGTPTTASVAFATSCVTNANRKYLLIQNVTTGSNVITVGIGFTPTTTQGIQLTAGAGITFESSYIPTGAVYVLSSVTASNFTILEA